MIWGISVIVLAVLRPPLLAVYPLAPIATFCPGTSVLALKVAVNGSELTLTDGEIWNLAELLLKNSRFRFVVAWILVPWNWSGLSEKALFAGVDVITMPWVILVAVVSSASTRLTVYEPSVSSTTSKLTNSLVLRSLAVFALPWYVVDELSAAVIGRPTWYPAPCWMRKPLPVSIAVMELDETDVICPERLTPLPLAGVVDSWLMANAVSVRLGVPVALALVPLGLARVMEEETSSDSNSPIAVPEIVIGEGRLTVAVAGGLLTV